MMFGKNAGAVETAKRIPKGSIGVEIGVWRGDSSELFLERASHLYLVDPWSPVAYEDSDEFGDYQAYLRRYKALVGSDRPEDFQRYYDAVYQSVVKRFAGKPVTIERCSSDEFLRTIETPVDWVYVDGSHSYSGCLHDLQGSRRIAKSCIFGDDYGNKPGVTEAVNAFVEDGDHRLEVFAGNQYQITL